MQVWTNEPIEEGEAWVKYDELYFTAKGDDDWSCNRSVDQQSFPFESKQWPKLWEGAYSPQQRWPSTAPPSIPFASLRRTHGHTHTHVRSHHCDDYEHLKLFLAFSSTDHPAYTQADITAVVKYAQRRGVRVMVEFDVRPR